MYKWFYQDATEQLLSLPILAMAIFVVTFGAVLYRVLKNGSQNKDTDAYLQQLPLADAPSADDHQPANSIAVGG